jgi:hypothetical protein
MVAATPRYGLLCYRRAMSAKAQFFGGQDQEKALGGSESFSLLFNGHIPYNLLHHEALMGVLPWSSFHFLHCFGV